jgi:hypothetical protein
MAQTEVSRTIVFTQPRYARRGPGHGLRPPQLRVALLTIEHHIDERLASSRLPAAA